MKSKVYWIFGTVFVLGLVANLAMEYYTRANMTLGHICSGLDW